MKEKKYHKPNIDIKRIGIKKSNTLNRATSIENGDKIFQKKQMTFPDGGRAEIHIKK